MGHSPATTTNRWLVLGLGAVGILGWLLYVLQPILTPFLAGAALAYLGNPMVDRLVSRGFSRVAAVVVVFAAFVLFFAMTLVIVIPLLAQQLQVVWQRLPLCLDWIQNTALPLILSWMGLEGSEVEVDQVRETVLNSWQGVSGVASGFAKQATTSGLAFLGFLANMTLIPVVSFYLLKDWRVIMARLQRTLPRSIESQTVSLVQACDEVMASFVRGQLMVMLALGIVYSVGLAVVGVDFALLIGLMAGLASIVPYLGFAVGLVAALIVAFLQFHDWVHPALVLGVFVMGQALEGVILTPLLVGDKIGLHPVAVIFAVLAGAQVFGFVGLLLALPGAAVLLVVLQRAFRADLNSAWYALPPAASE
ncbi:MAG: AI-2E family transporter [Gammaproteobacteria bacterium]